MEVSPEGKPLENHAPGGDHARRYLFEIVSAATRWHIYLVQFLRQMSQNFSGEILRTSQQNVSKFVRIW